MALLVVRRRWPEKWSSAAIVGTDECVARNAPWLAAKWEFCLDSEEPIIIPLHIKLCFGGCGADNDLNSDNMKEEGNKMQPRFWAVLSYINLEIKLKFLHSLPTPS